MNNLLIIILLCISSATHSGTPLTEEGKKVREISPDWSNQCDFMGTKEVTNASFGANPDVCKKRAFDEMKNKVGELGGNAYLVTYIDVSPCLFGGTTITFEAYRCPDEKSISVKRNDQIDTDSSDDLYRQLTNLKKLLDQGIINQEEYELQKKKILNDN